MSYEYRMRNVGVTIYRSGIALLVATAVAAQNVPRTAQRLETPTTAVRAVIDSFINAVDAERFQMAARWLDMNSFRQFFAQTVSSVRGTLPQPAMTAESLMAQDSTMTRAVAEWQLSKMRQYADSEPFSFLSHEFARVRTQRELFALTAEEAAARWIEAQDPRAAVRDAWRQSGCKRPIPSELLHTRWSAFRGIVVADSLAYALFETEFSRAAAPLVEPPLVITVRRTAAGWRIAPQSGLLTGGTYASVGFGGVDC